MSPTQSLDKARIRIALLEGIHETAEQAFRRAGYTNIVTRPEALTGSELHDVVREAHFLGIRSRTQIGEEILQESPRLVGVGCFCIGTNQVDLEAASKRGVAVFNAPYSNTRSVAELVLAETIFLFRNIPEKNAQCHRGGWPKSASDAYEIRGKTLGIIGYGNIGTQLGVLAEGMGMRVIYFDIESKLPMGNAQARDQLQDVLQEADLLTLHVPETPATRHMIGAAELRTMKKGSYLINASRGHVVDIDALHSALDMEHLAGAAIDVFPIEPKSNDEEFQSPLRGRPNVVLTPHIGGSTVEAQQNIGTEVAEKLIRFSDTGTTLSAVNFPEVSLPTQEGKHRILHIHNNVPGILSQINAALADEDINIGGQYLQTKGPIGYVVIEVDQDCGPRALERLRTIAGTIRARILF